jgi:hypothetical protein
MGASARSNRIALFIDGPRPAASVTKKALDQYKAYPGVNTTTIALLRMQQFVCDTPEIAARVDLPIKYRDKQTFAVSIGMSQTSALRQRGAPRVGD